MIEEKPRLIKIGETYLKFDFEFNQSNQAIIKEAYLTQINQVSREILEYVECRY